MTFVMCMAALWMVGVAMESSPGSPLAPEPPPTSLVWLQQDDTAAGPDAAEALRDLVICIERALAERPRFACEILEGCAVRIRWTGDDPAGDIRRCLDQARAWLEDRAP